MFTPPSTRAVPDAGSITEQRLDDVVHRLEIRGAPQLAELGRRIDAALASGVRWLLIDLERATAVPESVLVAAARDLRDRRGELILIGASEGLLAGYKIIDRPALAANAEQALMILKVLRPKTRIEPPAPA